MLYIFTILSIVCLENSVFSAPPSGYTEQNQGSVFSAPSSRYTEQNQGSVFSAPSSGYTKQNQGSVFSAPPSGVTEQNQGSVFSAPPCGYTEQNQGSVFSAPPSGYTEQNQVSFLPQNSSQGSREILSSITLPSCQGCNQDFPVGGEVRVSRRFQWTIRGADDAAKIFS